MRDSTVRGTRGTTIEWQVPITKPDDLGVEQPVDLLAVGTQLRVSVRRRRSEAGAPYIYKTLGVPGGPGGVVPGGPASNIALVTVAADETADAATTLLGVWEMELTEPDGTVTNIAGGTFKLRPNVRRGAVP